MRTMNRFIACACW